MAFDPAVLARRLHEARDRSRLSQQEVAEAIDVPRTAIVQIEAGRRGVSTRELVKLAAVYGSSVADLVDESVDEACDPDLLVVLHRLAPQLCASPDVDREILRCLDVCREGVALEQILGRGERCGPLVGYSLRVPRDTMNAVAQGAEVAREERRRLGLGVAPIADMANLLTTQRIWASGLELPDEMSGLFLNHPSIGIAILVNYGHARVRKRFSYAHEYAHALLDRDRVVAVTDRAHADDLVEKRANAFAASFLMPEPGVRTALAALDKGGPSRQQSLVYDVATDDAYDAERRASPGSQKIGYQDGVMLARHFGVSYPAAIYRLRSLHLISKPECVLLLEQQYAAAAYQALLPTEHDSESSVPAREMIAQVAHLAVEAYRREEISRGKLLDIAKKLTISGRELAAVAEAGR